MTYPLGPRYDEPTKSKGFYNLNYYGWTHVDGIFGDQTHVMTVTFQRLKGISADGIVGPVTWNKVIEDCNADAHGCTWGMKY